MTMTKKTAGLSRVEKYALDQSTLVTYFTGKNEEGQDFYVFYALRGECFDAYDGMIVSGDIDFAKLEQWGKIIAMDYGVPTKSVISIMQRDYKFNVDAMQDPQAIPTMITAAS